MTGYVLLAYGSMPPPGEAITAPVEANWEAGKVILKHTDNQKCLYTYTATLEDEKLRGVYEKRGCGDGEERGEFYADQYKRAAMPNKRMHATADTLPVIYLQPLGAAGDARRYGSAPRSGEGAGPPPRR